MAKQKQTNQQPATINPGQLSPVSQPTQETPAAELSYYQQTMLEMGLTDEKNKIRLKIEDLETGTDREIDYKICDEDEEGNIIFTPFNLERYLIQYDNEKATPTKPNINNSRRKDFKVKRLKIPQLVKDKFGKEDFAKYLFPKGADTQPFITPGIAEKWEKREKIKTLVATEGYKKAIRGWLEGMDIIGLSSISHYKEAATQQMYTDVIRVIKGCMVEEFVILYDGDCRNISLKDLQNKTDLSRRPNGFINSARKIRELLKDYPIDIYFASVNTTDITGHPKGLDDLYCAIPSEGQAITKDLVSFSRPPVYFHRHNIKFDLGKLYKWFMLDSYENFRSFHADIIENREFVFFGTTYRYNPDKGNCEIITPAEAADYFRVGDDYYKYVLIPNKYQKNERQFVRRLKATITSDHPVAKGKLPFITHINKYEAFCNVPDHVNYQPVINNCFNIYAKIEHEPEPGEFETIKVFIKHIFQNQYEIGLDYIQLLYQQPAQTLPVLCLVSKENNTGKSTFIKFIKAIFGQNATIIGNEDLANGFNAFWVAKLVIAIEETFVDKKSTTERIKSLATADKITMNAKGRDQVELDFFGKFILASNNEDNFIYASTEDIRYWVIKVPVITGQVNVKMMQNMIDEIPAFLHYLNTRQLSTTEESRMWFDPKLLNTEALEKLRQNSRPGIEKEIYEYLKTIYFEFGESEVLLTPTNANDLCIKRKQDNSYLSRIFRENLKVAPYTNTDGKETVKSYSVPYWGTGDDGEVIRREHKFKGRPFVFRAVEILDPHDLKLWRELHHETITLSEVDAPSVTLSVVEGPNLFTQPDFNEKDLPF